ncbi:MAG: site-2 protease family protein [Candidatus Sericytochromatia bacterium]
MSTTFHEAAHAYFALIGGDKTAYLGGQVSLDPTPHIRREPIGMVVVPLICLFTSSFLMGWASAPYDPIWARHNHRKAALMSFAGPAANLLLAVSAGLLLKTGLNVGFFESQSGFSNTNPVSQGLYLVLYMTFRLNLGLFVLNLLPLPGFDGSGVLCGFFDKETSWKISEVVNNPSFSIISFLIAFNVFPIIFRPISSFAHSLIF